MHGVCHGVCHGSVMAGGEATAAVPWRQCHGGSAMAMPCRFHGAAAATIARTVEPMGISEECITDGRTTDIATDRLIRLISTEC